ncbi:acid-sensing ion channel 2-like isoform X2 [Oratosquilla oratoria]|uniref:acid-sensing ion channel 2-like isoform X2 n=1 Tax=Oratosquilla oratoria TaxID=337810 RepID=UPI003F76460F
MENKGERPGDNENVFYIRFDPPSYTRIVAMTKTSPKTVTSQRTVTMKKISTPKKSKIIPGGLRRGSKSSEEVASFPRGRSTSLQQQKKGNLSQISKATKDKILTRAQSFTTRATESLIEFCQQTTAHGFNHIVEVRLPLGLRLFWAFVTAVSVGLLIFMATEATYLAFVLRRPTSEVNYQDNRSSGLRFPDVTLCDLAGFWKSKMEKFNVSETLASYLLVALRGTEVITSTLSHDTRLRQVLKDDLNKFLALHNVSLEEMVHMLSPRCEEIVMGCFSETAEYFSRECCEKMLRPYVTSMGLCFSTLGRQENFFKQTISGRIGGSTLLLANHLNEYMRYSPLILSEVGLAQEGFQISISNFDTTPAVATHTHGVSVAPSTAASIALDISTLDKRAQYASFWPWSGPQCIREEDIWIMTPAEMAYTENNLYFTLHYHDCFLEHLNCTAMPFNILREGFFTDLCFSTSLTQQVSYTTLKEERLDNLINTFASKIYIPEKSSFQLSIVNIYYKELSYTEYFEKMPTFATWFSDLGGQMGLFLGASFITVVELFFALCGAAGKIGSRMLHLIIRRASGTPRR